MISALNVTIAFLYLTRWPYGLGIFNLHSRTGFYYFSRLSILPRMAVSVTGCPKYGTSYMLSDVGNYKRLVIAVYPAYGDKTWPDYPLHICVCRAIQCMYV